MFITSEPAADNTGFLNVHEQESIAFTATTSGGQGDPAAYKYMWQMSTDGGATWADISNDSSHIAVSNILRISPILPEHNGIYRCIVDDGQN